MRAALVIAALAAAAAQRLTPPGAQLRQVASPGQELAGQAYYVPDDANVLAHWNASDMVQGAFRVGPAWTINGVVPLVFSALAPAQAGVFSSSNYFSLPASNVLQFKASYWLAMVFTTTVAPAAQQELLVTENVGTYTHGLQFDFNTSGTLTVEDRNFGHATTFGSALTAGAVNVLLYGWSSASGNVYSSLNGSATSTASVGAGPISGTSTSTFGLGPGGVGAAFANGKVIEIAAFNEPPSAALFSAVYSAVRQQLP